MLAFFRPEGLGLQAFFTLRSSRFWAVAVICAGLASCNKCKTAPDSASLDIVYERQINTEWCWAASAVMIARTLKVEADQCELVQSIHTASDCCSVITPTSICNQGGWPPLTELGFLFERTNSKALSFLQLMTEIGIEQRPVAMSIKFLGSNGLPDGTGHMMVAGGYKTAGGVQMVELYDPKCGGVSAANSSATCGSHWVRYEEYDTGELPNGTEYLHWDDFYEIRKP